jgi:hypothetical protein
VILVKIVPKTVLKLLVGLSVAFMLLNLARLGWVEVMGPMRLHGLWARFDMYRESSVPTWYSSMVLLAAAMTLAMIGLDKWRTRYRFAGHWVGLAVIFFLLSIDEIATFHELLSDRMQSLHWAGPFYYAWVIPAGAFVLFFVVAYLRFLFHLAPAYRLLFVVSGAIYVFGAVGLEMVEAEIQQAWGIHNLYHVVVTAEEGCEMLGASLFVYVLLTYLQTRAAQVCLELPRAQAADEADQTTAWMGATGETITAK